MGEKAALCGGFAENACLTSKSFDCSERILSTNFEQQVLQFKSGDSTPEYFGWRKQTTFVAAVDMDFNSRAVI
jgi:hypothetical protein